MAGYLFELGTAFFESCSYFEANIANQAIDALVYGFKAARQPYLNPGGPEAVTVTANPGTLIRGTSAQLTASIDDTRYDSNGYGIEPTQNVVAARYAIDLPSWQGAATYPMSPSDGAFDEQVEGVSAWLDTAGLSLGRHTLFVEGQDANGNWGVPSARLFVGRGRHAAAHADADQHADTDQHADGDADPADLPDDRRRPGQLRVRGQCYGQQGGRHRNALKTQAGRQQRPVLWFDLASVPPGANLQSATVSLWLTSVKATPVAVSAYRLTEAWTETGVTWNYRNLAQSQPWLTPGGSYDPLAIDTVSVNGPANSWASWDVWDALAGWLYGGNLGMILTSPVDGVTRELKFRSRENSTIAQRPKLMSATTRGRRRPPRLRRPQRTRRCRRIRRRRRPRRRRRRCRRTPRCQRRRRRLPLRRPIRRRRLRSSRRRRRPSCRRAWCWRRARTWATTPI